jgi:arylsulfatase
MKIRIGMALAMVAWLAACMQEQVSAPPPPDIVLIVADDLGYTDLGAFGGEIDTPNLDALALQGVRLTNFHTSASCAPTRAMLITGTDNHIAGMGSQGGLQTELQSQHRAYSNRLLPEVPTFPEGLRALGYRTYMTGKWHLGAEPESQPRARGFERSFALMQGGAGHFDDTGLFERYGKAHWLEDGEAVVLPADFYTSDFLTEKLMTYIGAAPQDQPVFGYLAFTAPHWPLQAPVASIEKYRGRYDHGWDELRATRMSGAISAGVVPDDAQPVNMEAGMVAWSELSADERAQALARMEVYAAMIDRLDENVGRLVDFLRQRGNLHNTVFVFMSDNGAEAHDMESDVVHGEWLKSNFDNSIANIGTASSYTALQVAWARATAVPFRASKSKVSEGGIRVPAFVAMPGLAAGVDDAYMRVMDLGPTLLEIAGGVPTPSMMGRSLLDRWWGGDTPYGDQDVIAYEVYGRRGAQRGQWKVLLQEAPFGTGEWQLYNLARDLGEQEDLSDEHPQIRAELIDAWQQYAETVGVVLPEHPIRY